MADVQIEGSANVTLNTVGTRLGPVWVDEDTAYVFYVSGLSDLEYRKTVNGGANWGDAVSVKAATVWTAGVWFDKWTPGDGGTKVHIVYIDSDSDDVLYRNLDTSNDTLSAEKTIFDGVTAGPGGWDARCLDITKSRGGNLYCGFWIDNDGENGFYRSEDDGDTWAARATVCDGNAVDLILLFPGDEADTNDIWCIYWDVSADEISLKVYDDSENSWSETSISLNMADISAALYQMSATQRASDNHVILAAWNMWNNAASDLMVWDIGGAASIVAKTNVLTDTAEAAQCAVFINQQTDDIYVAYLKGTDFTTEVGVHYKKSDDGGGSWGGETGLSDDAEDDLRGIWAGHSVGDEGGYFMPVWFNDDLDDLMTNTANAVVIAAAAAGETFYQSCAGAFASSGALGRQTSIFPAGVLSSTGAIGTVATWYRSLAGTFASAGTLAGKALKGLAGTLASSGSLVAKAGKVLAGVLASAGTLATTRPETYKALAGALALAGVVTTKQFMSLAGAFASAGNLAAKKLVAVAYKSLAGTLVATGSLARKTATTLAGVLTFGEKTIEDQTDASLDDGYEIEDGGNVYTSESEDYVFSHISAAFREWGAFRFHNGPFPQQGRTVTAAYVTIKAGISYYYMNADLYVEKAANPATLAPGETSDITGRPRTIAGVAWVEDGLEGWVDSPSLVSVIQELVDSYSPGAVMLILKPRSDAVRYVDYHSWDSGDHLQGPKLHLEWKEPGAGGVLSTVSTWYRSLAGTFASTGTLGKKGFVVVAGALSSAGTVVPRAGKALAGVLSSTGSLATTLWKYTTPVLLQGTLALTGAATGVKLVLKSVGGTLVSAGAMASQFVLGKAIGGTLTLAGTLVGKAGKALAGSLTLTGGLVRKSWRAFTGSLGLVGSLIARLWGPGKVIEVQGSVDTTIEAIGSVDTVLEVEGSDDTTIDVKGSM